MMIKAHMKEIPFTVYDMGKGSIFGEMELCMRVNGNKITFKDMESYHSLMENNIKEIF